MINKIKVDIFGIWDEVLQNKKDCGGCSSADGKGGCGCSKRKSGIAIKGAAEEAQSGGCGGCGSKKSQPKSVGELYTELKGFIENSAVKEVVELQFYDLRKINVLDYDDIRVLTERDYETPYVVIDGIVRYYGGISQDLIYKDVQELVEF